MHGFWEKRYVCADMCDWIGKVVVVDCVAAGDVRGASAVVVTGTDAAVVGEAVGRLRSAGIRACGYVGDAGDEAAGQMAAELFPGAEVVVASPPAGGSA